MEFKYGPDFHKFDDVNLKNASPDNPISFEDALNQTGHGKFSYLVLFVCSLSLLAVGFENGVAAYLLPSARCDLQLTTSQMGYINVGFMTGGALSACLWGVLADGLGRRRVLLLSLGGAAMVTFAGSLSQGFAFLMATRVINGFFIGAPGCIAFVYLSELTPERVRRRYVFCGGSAFIASWMFLPAIALFLIPLKFEFYIISESFKFNSWRLYLMVFVLPSLLSATLLLTLPESPRFLLTKGQKEKALEIMTKIFAFNTGRPGKEYPVKYLLGCAGGEAGPALVGGGRTARAARAMLAAALLLLKAPFMLQTVFAMLLMFSCMYGGYGLGLWIPELLSRFRNFVDMNPDASATVCELKQLGIENTTTQNNLIYNNLSAILLGNRSTLQEFAFDVALRDIDVPCDVSMDPQVFKDTMIIGVACIVYNFVSVLISDHVGYRVLPAVSLSIGAVASVLFLWLKTPLQCLLAASLFQAAMMTANIVVIGMILEVFPPKLNSMAVCVATFAGRFGSICSNLSFGIFLEYSCHLPIYLVTAISIGAAIIVAFVKKTTMDDTPEENGEKNTTDREGKTWTNNTVTTHM